MTRLIWFVGWTGVAVWSLLALVAYGAIDLVGGFLMRNADMFSGDPETVVRIWRLFGFVRGASTSVVLVVWGVVSLAILAVPWLLGRMIGPAGPARVARPGVPSRSPDGVIDLAPGEYWVDSRTGGDDGPRGAVPPVPRRS